MTTGRHDSMIFPFNNKMSLDGVMGLGEDSFFSELSRSSTFGVFFPSRCFVVRPCR